MDRIFSRLLGLIIVLAGIAGMFYFLTIPFRAISARSQADLTSILIAQEGLSLLCIIASAFAYKQFVIKHRRRFMQVFAVALFAGVIQLVRYPYNISAIWSAYTGIEREFMSLGRVPVMTNPLVRQVRKGMSREQILNLLGSPTWVQMENQWTYRYLFYGMYFSIWFNDKDIVSNVSQGYG